MKWLLFLAALGLSFMLWGCVIVADEHDDNRIVRAADRDVTDTIRRANREMERRFEAGDMAGVAAMYADDGMVLSSRGSRHEGREAIDTYWARFENPVSWDLDVLSVEGPASMPVQRGRSTMVRMVDGEEHTGVVEFIVIWRLEDDGEYRIVVDAYW